MFGIQPRLRSFNRMALIPALLLIVYASGLHAPASTSALAAGYDWLQYNGNPQHSGNNTLETAITPGNVGTLRQLFQVSLPSPADGAPVYLRSVNTAAGTKDLVFVTTKAGHIIALDARTGATLWTRQYPAGSCRINGGPDVCYTTSSPAIDPNRRFVYTYGLDGYVHKLRVGSGMEITGNGWPQLATRKPSIEKGSSALGFATAANGTTYLYMTNGGYPGDQGNYQGHVTAINLATGVQHVFNTECSNRQDVHFVVPPNLPSCARVQSAVWARAGVVYNPNTNRIYLATGNGDFVPAQYGWGDSVLALTPSAHGIAGRPLDSYTPTNYEELDQFDLDLGSTAPAILPAPANSNVRNLGLQSGKDAKLRLLNLDNLSGQSGPGNVGGEIALMPVPQGGQVLTTPAVWRNPADGTTWTFVSNNNGVSALRLNIDGSGTPSLQTMWQQLAPGFSPLIANNVLFQARNNVIEAREPLTGAQLWSSNAIGGIHWNSPVVANGVLYITDSNNNLFAFSPNGAS